MLLQHFVYTYSYSLLVIGFDWALKFARTSAKLSATFTEWTTLWFSLNSLDDLAHFKQGLPTGGWTSSLFFSKDGQILGLSPTLIHLNKTTLYIQRQFVFYSCTCGYILTPPPPSNLLLTIPRQYFCFGSSVLNVVMSVCM